MLKAILLTTLLFAPAVLKATQPKSVPAPTEVAPHGTNPPAPPPPVPELQVPEVEPEEEVEEVEDERVRQREEDYQRSLFDNFAEASYVDY